jgi:biopolymer transport protein TolR
MADVMLVLLIIFMITAPLIAAGFEATMPTGINLIKTETEDPNDVTLGIDMRDSFFINAKSIAKKDVVARLRQLYTTTHTQDKIMYLKAHQGLKMEKIQEAIAMAREAGVAVIAAITDQKPMTESTVSTERGQ